MTTDNCAMHDCNNEREYGKIYCTKCWTRILKQSEEVDDQGLAEIRAEKNAGI